MALIMLDFTCPNCDCKFEDLVDSKERVAPCPECNTEAPQRVSATIATVGPPGSERFQEVMRKRSHDHSVKEAKKNVDQLASKFGSGAKPRAQSKWNIRSHKKSSE